MVIGEIGDHGDLVQSAVEVEQNLNQDHVVARHLPMVVHHVVDQLLKPQVINQTTI
jgi:hypothetical protein